MADQYLTAAYIRAHLGSGYVTAAVSTTGVTETTIIEAATSMIQTALRNSGYSPPVSTDGTSTDIEEFVKLATLGCYRELLASIPEASIPLPANWSTHPHRLAYASILSGEAKLAATPSTPGAVGGWLMTNNDPDADATATQRASRDELSGW